MLVNNALVNMIHMYVEYGYEPKPDHPLYEAFSEWLKNWTGKKNG